MKLPDCWSTIDSLLVISCDVDVDGFGVDGADGVDVPDVDAVADEHGTPSFTIFTTPLRPQVNTQFQIQTQNKQKKTMTIDDKTKQNNDKTIKFNDKQNCTTNDTINAT